MNFKFGFWNYYRYFIFLISIFLFWPFVMIHGTFIPNFVWKRTGIFPLTTPLLNSNWRPSFKIIISLTTLPFHVKKLKETLHSLKVQNLQPNIIYLNIPKKNKRIKKNYCLKVNMKIKFKKNYQNLKILRVNDYGPLTKIIPILKLETDPDTLIITLDDDFIYDSKLIQTLAWFSFHHPTVAWGECGWGVQYINFHKIGVIPIYVPYFLRNFGRKIDILQACCGNSYRIHFFKFHLDKIIDKNCFFTDDIWISSHLAMLEFDRVLLPININKFSPIWKKNKNYLDISNQLSCSNNINFIDIKCIKSIEIKFQKNWLKIDES